MTPWVVWISPFTSPVGFGGSAAEPGGPLKIDFWRSEEVAPGTAAAPGGVMLYVPRSLEIMSEVPLA